MRNVISIIGIQHLVVDVMGDGSKVQCYEE